VGVVKNKNSQVNPVIASVRRALGREAGSPVPPRPPVLPPRPAGAMESEIELLLDEIGKLSGETMRLRADSISTSLAGLVHSRQIVSATCWGTPWIKLLGIEDRLAALGVELLSPQGNPADLARCDLGVTEVDYALPETGTLALLSSPEKPRAVSLLPRVHLALLDPAAFRADMHQVFAEAKGQPYLVFITGPSRTADIELTVTLGVHGPRQLHVWIVE
jgi:L-lactate dehydrogenase complex protein LldG